MKLQSNSIRGISGDFPRSLLISAALHAVVLWQTPLPPAGSGMLAQPESHGGVLNALLQHRQELQLPTPAVPQVSTLQPAVALPPSLAATSPPVAETLRQQAAELGGARSPPADEGLDANGLRQYRLSLAVAARRFKLYPPLARANGWSGTVEVAVAIAANGVAQPVQLVQSSGHPALDAAALEMIGQAALQAAVPPGLRGQNFSVALPVAFDARSE
ncbi:MAG: energy transducer TonB [Proteobacteria bacterium]|nr:energy transducer TonB [Pseudomonadota bacterium]